MFYTLQLALINIQAFFAATATPACKPSSSQFFFIPPWWEYLKGQQDSFTGKCEINFNFPHDIFGIGLAALDILLRLAGFVAVVMIIVAGFQYMFSLGNSDKITASRKRIQNSLIGLAIAFVATLVVTFIGREFVL